MRCPGGYDFDTCLDHHLDKPDVMESALRSLAAAVPLKKTGDAESADRLRGIVAPGDEIAPSWLIDSSTEYPPVVHRQRTCTIVPTGRPLGAMGDKAGRQSFRNRSGDEPPAGLLGAMGAPLGTKLPKLSRR